MWRKTLRAIFLTIELVRVVARCRSLNLFVRVARTVIKDTRDLSWSTATSGDTSALELLNIGVSVILTDFLFHLLKLCLALAV